MIELNKFYISDSVQFMKEKIPDNYFDLTVTSPPYDKLRNYKDFTFDYKTMLNELYRVMKFGGVVVWVVADSVIKNSETLTSFKQSLYAKEECGFNVHDTMFYQKNSYPFPMSNRYYQQVEYMFVFSKGIPKTSNLQKIKTTWKKKTTELSTTRQPDGSTKEMKYEKGKDERVMDNIWLCNTGFMRTTKDKIAYNHPAQFPEELAERHILTWSNENDIVFDPMCGAGTTCKMAYLNKRNFIGIDISEEYITDICIPRLEQYGWKSVT
jgi:DNA modification methylase